MKNINQVPKIILYAIDRKGDGRSMKVGEYDSIEEVEILVGMFNKDVLLKLEYEICETKENS